MVTVADMTDLFIEETGMCPQIDVHLNDVGTVTYIPSHIQYMLQELLKNACVAEVQKVRRQSSAGTKTEPGNIRLELIRKKDRLCIIVNDNAGGLPNEHVWSYGYSGWRERQKKPKAKRDMDTTGSDATGVYPPWHKRVAGGGVGLAMLKMYVELFGGSVGVLKDLPYDFNLLSSNAIVDGGDQDGVYVILAVGKEAEDECIWDAKRGGFLYQQDLHLSVLR